MLYRFGDFIVDEARQELHFKTELISIELQVWRVLLYLLRQANRVVSKEELLEQCWPGTFVSESAMMRCLSKLRQTLRDDSRKPLYIKTIHGRGYRFVAPITQLDNPSLAAMSPSVPASLPSAASFPSPQFLTELSTAERRQVTVLSGELVGLSTLATRLDPEDFYDVLRLYSTTCTNIIKPVQGYLPQPLDQGLMVYFGYPQAQEDAAQRAVRTGLELLHGLASLHESTLQRYGVLLTIRLGIHTGVVIVEDIGTGHHAIGSTPHFAWRLQAIAAPDTVVVSATTWQLVEGYYTAQKLGQYQLPGDPTALAVYQILQESGVQTRFEVVSTRGLTPFVGRSQELRLLQERWEQAQAGQGQMVLISGEPGIGKSRLVKVMQDRVGSASHILKCQCSPYTQYTAFAPLLDLLVRTLQWQPEDSPEARLQKLEAFVAQYTAPQDETITVLALLLSLPLPAGRYALLTLSPQKQRQQILEIWLTILLEQAARRPVWFVMEDLHWADPSTVELLTLLFEQGPTAALCTVLTCRPTFASPWGLRAHLTTVVLDRLAPAQVTEMVQQLTHGKSLPPEIIEPLLTKMDGIPLFVEELTKAILTSEVLHSTGETYELCNPLHTVAIPTTLHDTLMVRLDRQASVKAVAQLAATIGRQFSYALLRAAAPWDKEVVDEGLQQLVADELLYRQGVPSQATYLFKHALICEAAYQSLLKSTRQQYHQRIAEVLENQFAEIAAKQPELLAQHYAAANLAEQAVQYWHKAGQKAIESSGYIEAINHFKQGLALLKNLTSTHERMQQELTLQIALGQVFMATKGQGAWEVEQIYLRARELCQELASVPQLFSVIGGLCGYYVMRGALSLANDLGTELLSLAQQQESPIAPIHALQALGSILCHRGEITLARAHLERAIALYRVQQRGFLGTPGSDPGVVCLSYAGMALWLLGFPNQASQKLRDAMTLARSLAHPYSLAVALVHTSMTLVLQRDSQLVLEQTEEGIALAAQYGAADFHAYGTFLHGAAMAIQGRGEKGLVTMQEGISAYQVAGAALGTTMCGIFMAEAYDMIGCTAKGLRYLTETLAWGQRHGEHHCEAELLRLKGVLLSQDMDNHPAAEVCFQQALASAQRQQAKAFELRAAVSLGRLWQQQMKKEQARQLLTPIYGWFTEGFDTLDLQEARALLDELA